MKIISGLQTGVDQIALEIAYDLGLETGGTCAPGFMTENGRAEELANKYGVRCISPELQRGYKSKGYSKFWNPRTEQNVIDSDATVYLDFTNGGWSPGCTATHRYCKKHDKSLFRNPSSKDLLNLIEVCNISVLNVAGNRGSKLTADNEAIVRSILYSVFHKLANK